MTTATIPTLHREQNLRENPQIVDVRQRDAWISQAKVQKLAYLFFASTLYLTGLSIIGAAFAGVIPIWNIVLGLLTIRLANDAHDNALRMNGMMRREDIEALRREAPYLTFKQLESRVRLTDLMYYEILSQDAVRQKLLEAMEIDPLDPSWIRLDGVTRQPRAQEFLAQGIINMTVFNTLVTCNRAAQARTDSTNTIKRLIGEYRREVAPSN